jgi:hypothetical protein
MSIFYRAVIFAVNVYDINWLGFVTFEKVAIFAPVQQYSRHYCRYSGSNPSHIILTSALVGNPNSFLTSSSCLKYFKSNYLLATESYLIIKSEFTAENILYFYTT